MRAEMREHVEVLQHDLAAARQQLAAACEEAALLREYYQAHRAHIIAKQELAAIYRRHAIERAMEVEFDPLTTPLQ